jgi:2-oxoglutarate ferredoxin oxidoreductase subunit gamma
MSSQGFNKFINRISEKTTVLLDLDNVKDVKLDYKSRFISLPASTIAKELGYTIGANFVMLGKLISTTKIIPLKLVEEVIINNTPEKYINKNLEALKKGYFT